MFSATVHVLSVDGWSLCCLVNMFNTCLMFGHVLDGFGQVDVVLNSILEHFDCGGLHLLISNDIVGLRSCGGSILDADVRGEAATCALLETVE